MIGVDEMALNPLLDPPLSSIQFDVDRIASLYADSLSDILDGVPLRNRESDDEQLMQVVERESSRAS